MNTSVKYCPICQKMSSKTILQPIPKVPLIQEEPQLNARKKLRTTTSQHLVVRNIAIRVQKMPMYDAQIFGYLFNIGLAIRLFY